MAYAIASEVEYLRQVVCRIEDSHRSCTQSIFEIAPAFNAHSQSRCCTRWQCIQEILALSWSRSTRRCYPLFSIHSQQNTTFMCQSPTSFTSPLEYLRIPCHRSPCYFTVLVHLLPHTTIKLMLLTSCSRSYRS